jgi:hypothetical protein
MGWLRDLMGALSPPIDGYGELARRALAHPEWPADTQPQARSLAALFSKLDRGIEIEWLADRDAAQRALALVLGCPIETVRRAVTRDRADGSHGFVRWLDLPYARPLALREEPLPPGLPSSVVHPASWRRLWWLAPSGSGRSLLGQWLAARGLARHLVAVHWREAVDRWTGAGPLFLELERADDVAGLEAALPDGPVCVAAPAPPAQSEAAWELVHSPSLLDTLPALLVWLDARLPRDGAFDVDAAQAWLRPLVASGELPSFGALLGAAGLLDARGLRDLRGQTLAQLAEPFVNERLEQASSKGSDEARWLARFGFDALIGIAQSALVSGDMPWEAARSLDEWIALAGEARSPRRVSTDVDGRPNAKPPIGTNSGHEVLVPAELQSDPPQGDRARQRGRSATPAPLRPSERAPAPSAPGAYRLVRGLVDAGLLAQRSPGRLALSPKFLEAALLARARRALVREGTPLAWGEALLSPHAAPTVLETLYEQLGRDFGALEQLAELDVSSQPALVVATEAALVCLGLRALCGAEVPTEYLESAWNEQLAGLVELPGELPRPRLLCYAHHRVAPLARHAVWMLALLAASELLAERRGRAHPLLRPWGGRAAPEALGALLDAIYVELAQPELAEREWAVEAFALVGRLLESDAELDPDSEAGERDTAPSGGLAWHPLARPARLVRALTDGEIDAAWLEGFGDHPLDLRALGAACELRQVAWSRMAHALWKTWQHRGCPAECDRLFAPDGPHRDRLWPHLPAEVLGAAWERWTERAAWPLDRFGGGLWSAFVDYFAERWRRAPGSPVWAQAFEQMSVEHLQQIIARAELLAAEGPEVRGWLERAWQRFPARMSALLTERCSAADARGVARLLEAAPVPLDDELLPALGQELSQRSSRREVIDAARAWLLAKISARRGDWRAAYALLAELESRLARAERARGASASFG